ncbi:MAG: DDE-type integrase/transposase/recombinase [Planctomycetes bacterium]|nr:DDE-type integrase/transposase/recombinase [Planctomycetota bacterium]
MEASGTSICLIFRAVLLSARWARHHKRLCLEQAVAMPGDAGQLQAENLELRDVNELQSEQIAVLRRRLKAAGIRRPYSVAERLRILWCVEYFGIPGRQIPKRLGVARLTVWRWRRRIQDGIGLCGHQCRASVGMTSDALVHLVGEMHRANPQWGRRRIALALGTLGVFLAASTVRNILGRPRPRPASSEGAAIVPEESPQTPRQIVARYPNHVWSVDRTRVWRWRVWPTWVLAAIDHHSRRIMALCPLEGPNAGWVIDALEQAFVRHGPPRHLISDQESVFTSGAFRDMLGQWQVKQRFGAVGKHGSIAVTERLIWSLKHEWLCRVPVIKGLDHIGVVLGEFEQYYNGWRAHSTVSGAVPDLVHAGTEWQALERTAKHVPSNIERHFFSTARITAFRLADAA